MTEYPVLQVPDFGKEFILATDASDLEISAVLNQRVGQNLATLAYYSRLLTPDERNYSTYEKERLAVLFGREKCRSYLKHKEFELHCDNLFLCWLLKRANEIGCLGRWVLRLAPFKFKVRHTRGADNVVADALSRMFAGVCPESPEITWATLLQYLQLVYSPLRSTSCVTLSVTSLQKILTRQAAAHKFSIHKNLLCFPLRKPSGVDGSFPPFCGP